MARTARSQVSQSRSRPTHPLLVLELQRATHAVALALDTLLTDVGVSQGEAHVLALLADGAPHTVGDLQQGLHHRPSTLTGILDRLEARGLVRRTLNPSDRRSFLIALSGPGRKAVTRVLDVLHAIEQETTARVAARDVDGFHAVAKALVGGIGNTTPRGGP